MPRLSKKDEAERLERLHRVLSEHARVEPDIRFWLIHVLHWHVAILAAIAVSVVALTALSTTRVDASENWPIYLQDQP